MPVFQTIDFDADGAVDLLVTSRCGSPTSATSWSLYRGTPAGYASAPRALALPTGFAAGAFADSFDELRCEVAPTRPRYALFDLTGDRRPDLILTSVCGDRSVGSSSWRVYPGTDSGFGAALTFTLPSGYAADAFIYTAGQTFDCARSQTPYFALYDLDGDGARDLVVFRACDDPTVGVTHLRFYRNRRTSFDSSATRWTLPAGYRADLFTSPVHTTPRCSAGDMTSALIDIDGDRRPDIVLSSSCDDPSIGTTHWIVHPNTGSGFAPTPTRWTLPRGSYPAGAFELYGRGPSICGSPGDGIFSGLLDLDGDGRSELIVTRECSDTSIGATAWKFHRSTGSGFAEAASRLTLPSGYGLRPFSYVTAGAARCAGATAWPGYTFVDAQGDGRNDLLVNSTCDETGTGTSVWKLHRWECP